MELETPTVVKKSEPAWAMQLVWLVTSLVALLLPQTAALDDRLSLLSVALSLITWRVFFMSSGGWIATGAQLAVLMTSILLTGGW